MLPPVDCVGSVCSNDAIFFFGIDQNASVVVYNSYKPLIKQSSLLNAIAWNLSTNKLLFAGDNGIFVADEYAPLLKIHSSKNNNNVSCISTNDRWYAYAISNYMNVVAYNDEQLVSSFKSDQEFTAVKLMNNRYLIAGDSSGGLMIHNCHSHLLSTNFKSKDYIQGQSSINCIDVCTNRMNWFTMCNDSRYTYVFDIAREKMIYAAGNHTSPVNECSFNPIQPSLIVSCGLDKRIILHDLRVNEHEQQMKNRVLSITAAVPLNCIQYLPMSEKYVLCCSTNGYIYVYDLRRSLKPVFVNNEIKHESQKCRCIIDLSIHPTLKYSEMHQKLNLNVNQSKSVDESISNFNELSSISSAVAQLPNYMKQKFGIVDISNAFNDENINENKNKTSVKKLMIEKSTKAEMNESVIRKIIAEEIEKSEIRMMSKISHMMGQMHSDLIQQFVTNEMSFETTAQQILKELQMMQNNK